MTGMSMLLRLCRQRILQVTVGPVVEAEAEVHATPGILAMTAAAKLLVHLLENTYMDICSTVGKNNLCKHRSIELLPFSSSHSRKSDDRSKA